MARIEVENSGFKTYPGGIITASIPMEVWEEPNGAYLPAIPEGNPVMVQRMYLGKPMPEGGRKFWEQSYPYKKPYGTVSTPADYDETLTHHGIPVSPEYNPEPAAVLWVPKRQEITVVQFPQSGAPAEGRVTQVRSVAPPPVEYVPLANGKQLVGALGDIGFDTDDFRFLAQGTQLRQQTGISSLLSRIIPQRIEKVVEEATAAVQDRLYRNLPSEMGELTHMYRAVVRRPLESPSHPKAVQK